METAENEQRPSLTDSGAADEGEQKMSKSAMKKAAKAALKPKKEKQNFA